jgi:hypothetical protein
MILRASQQIAIDLLNISFVRLADALFQVKNVDFFDRRAYFQSIDQRFAALRY